MYVFGNDTKKAIFSDSRFFFSLFFIIIMYKLYKKKRKQISDVNEKKDNNVTFRFYCPFVAFFDNFVAN